MRFPLSTHIAAGYARTMDHGAAADARESGITNFGIYRNPRSILTDRARVVMGEV